VIRVAFVPYIPPGESAIWLGQRPLAGLGPYLEPHGVEWGVPVGKSDLVWVDAYRERDANFRRARPIILHLTQDCGSLQPPGRAILEHPRVKLAVKTVVFRDRNLYNAPHYRQWWYHDGLIADSMPDGEDGRLAIAVPELDAVTLSKLRVSFSWLYLDSVLQYAQASDPPGFDRRDVDVSFVGTTAYDRPTITRHRQAAVRSLNELAGRFRVVVGDRRSTFRQAYHDLLRRSRVCVSPWGHSESCIRDVEAILSGCILVKPDTSFAETWPDYHSLPTVFRCRPDFGDLPVALEQALARYDDLRSDLDNAARWLRGMASHPVLAERVAGLVREAVES